MASILHPLLAIFFGCAFHVILAPALPYTTHEASYIEVWKWDINPKITNPACGVAYRANINLKSSPNDTHVAANPVECERLSNFLTLRPGTPDIDLILLCDTRRDVSDLGTQDDKLFVTYDVGRFEDGIIGSESGDQEIPGTVEAWNPMFSFFITVPSRLGVKVDADTKVVEYQSLYC